MFVPNETQLIQWAKEHFSYGVNVKSAQMGFVGWNPAITLHHVDVLTDDGRLALNIQQVKTVLNLYALLFNSIELNDVIVEGMKMGIEYQHDGTIVVSDLSTLQWHPNQLNRPISHH